MTRTIIVPLDGSTLSEQSLPHAVHLARALDASLHLVRVHVPVLAFATAEAAAAIPDPALDAKVRDSAEKWLIAKAAQVKGEYSIGTTFELRVGSPADEVVATARERDALLVVCTTHGHGGWAPQWLGSVADAIVRHSPCPVLAMSEDSVKVGVEIRRILVPLDGSETSAAILPHVREVARATGAGVDLYRVVAPPWVGDVLNALQSNQMDRFGIDPTADAAKVELDRVAQDLVVSGVHATALVEVATNPTRAILDRIAAAKPDLVAMSNHGRGLSRVFMGSVADKVLRAGGRPMLCWRAPHAADDDSHEPMFATAASGPTA